MPVSVCYAETTTSPPPTGNASNGYLTLTRVRVAWDALQELYGLYQAGLTTSKAPSTLSNASLVDGAAGDQPSEPRMLKQTEVRARRPKVPKLVTDPQLAEAVTQRLGMGWSPHAVAADPVTRVPFCWCARRPSRRRAVRCSGPGRRLLAVATAPPQAAEATQPL